MNRDHIGVVHKTSATNIAGVGRGKAKGEGEGRGRGRGGGGGGGGFICKREKAIWRS